MAHNIWHQRHDESTLSFWKRKMTSTEYPPGMLLISKNEMRAIRLVVDEAFGKLSERLEQSTETVQGKMLIEKVDINVFLALVKWCAGPQNAAFSKELSDAIASLDGCESQEQ